jgi:hypothetical protein
MNNSLSDSNDPYYGYLLVTVNPDDTWKPEFKAAHKSELVAGKTFQVLDPKP